MPVLEVRPAIPIVMGANIGTTVTNLLVALTQAADRTVFRRAFAGATVHDIFNWSTVIILLPLEAATGFLYYMTHVMTASIGADSSGQDINFLNVITDPLTEKIIQVRSNICNSMTSSNRSPLHTVLIKFNQVTEKRKPLPSQKPDFGICSSARWKCYHSHRKRTS